MPTLTESSGRFEVKLHTVADQWEAWTLALGLEDQKEIPMYVFARMGAAGGK